MRITLARNATILAAYRNHYRIEQWHTTGRRIAVYERRVPWFPPGGSHIADPQRPTIAEIYYDADGLLWVHITQNEPKATILEVLDLNVLRVVASVQRLA